MAPFKCVCLAALLLACVASAAPLWGDQGHELTAQVATALLSSSAQSAVDKILDGQTLMAVSTWADSVKKSPGYQWSAVLHYINTPDWACTYDPTTDCADNACVAGAISNYTYRLVTQTDKDQVNEALKFLTHFAGDIHQPLHVAFASDQGGNLITGKYDDSSVTLHAIWDTSMIEDSINNRFSGDQNSYGDYLTQQVQAQSGWAANSSDWYTCASQKACPDPWASETAELACTHAYVDQDGTVIKTDFSLGDDYYNFNYQIVDMQLARGGVRLAGILNTLFADLEKVAFFNPKIAQQQHKTEQVEELLVSNVAPAPLASNGIGAALWGQQGHQLTALVADALIKASTRQALQPLLVGQSLSDVSTWADQVKVTPPYKWSAGLHFIDTPDWACNFDYSRDCGNDQCVAGAILNYTTQLSTSSDTDVQSIAMKFLTHFVGDIHQPMHVAFTSDRGGNSVTGTFEGQSVNLHGIWDFSIIEKRLGDDFGNSVNEYANYLINSVSQTWKSQYTQWINCDVINNAQACVSSWAMESAQLCCTNGEVDVDGSHLQSGFNLGDDYYNRNYPVVDLQLAKGGARLAALLDAALAGH